MMINEGDLIYVSSNSVCYDKASQLGCMCVYCMNQLNTSIDMMGLVSDSWIDIDDAPAIIVEFLDVGIRWTFRGSEISPLEIISTASC